MKYLVFSGERYYPAGGMGDFSEMFNTLDEAKAHADKLINHPDWVIPDWQEIATINEDSTHSSTRHIEKQSNGQGRMVVFKIGEWS